MKNIYRFLFGRFLWIQYSDQLKYKGGRKGLFHGKGTLKYASGSTYTGEFFEGSKMDMVIIFQQKATNI